MYSTIQKLHTIYCRDWRWKNKNESGYGCTMAMVSPSNVITDILETVLLEIAPSRHARLNLAFDFLAQPAFGDVEVVAGLQIDPECRRGAEVARQT